MNPLEGLQDKTSPQSEEVLSTAMPSADFGARASTALQPISLTSLLGMTENTGASQVEYVIGGQRLADSDREKAAG